jgi:glycogen debranching enzyme
VSSAPDADGSPLRLTSAGDVDTLVRVRGTHFVVSNRLGDIAPAGARELGLFADDTRHLSHYELGIEGESLIYLSSDSIDPAVNQIDLMVSEDGKLLEDPRNFLHVRRRQLVDDAFRDAITLVNYEQRQVQVAVWLAFDADFADVFEVRGHRRGRRGRLLEPEVGADSVALRYEGLDGLTYLTWIQVRPTPTRIDGTRVRFDFALPQDASHTIEFCARPAVARSPTVLRLPPLAPFEARVAAVRREDDAFRDEAARFKCDDTVFQQVLDRSVRDLHSLAMRVGEYEVLTAGVPWFRCPFGRDALLAGYESILLNPGLAASSLRMLATYQGRTFDEFTEEEPGKIFHELRFGEMTRTREIPHTPYYGSIDATPLFVIVLDATHRATADEALLRDLAPALRAALAWIDRRSEDGTRPVSYARVRPSGLSNQGWKDSGAGVSYPDGRRADAPIALCEVQGYCADAYARGARLLRALGEAGRADVYERRADGMRDVLERAFWMEDAGRYAYAIDGHGRCVTTVVSNLGHLLWSRAADPTRARATADLLVSPECLSAYGIRTLAAGQPVYNPLSYHNGTVWPHDNAIIAKGMANYDLTGHTERVFDALARAMPCLRDRRLPELYCGMSGQEGSLVRYPVACSPQAWAAAAPFLLLQAVLGIHLDGPHGRLWIRNPRMPSSMNRIDIDRLRVGASQVSLRICRSGKHCHVERLDVLGAPLRTEVVTE